MQHTHLQTQASYDLSAELIGYLQLEATPSSLENKVLNHNDFLSYTTDETCVNGFSQFSYFSPFF